MTAVDKPAFAEAMLTLCETFNEPISDVKIEAYFSVLQDAEIGPVLSACRLALRSCKFFPRPVELREFIDGSVEDAAEQAWAAVLGEIRRVGYIGRPSLEPRALRAVNELWGGWQRLCETLPAEGPELVGWIKQFKATYASVGRVEERLLTPATIHPAVQRFIQTTQLRIAERES